MEISEFCACHCTGPLRPLVLYIETLIGHVMCLRMLVTAAVQSFEVFYMYMCINCMSLCMLLPSLHRESANSLICNSRKRTA